MTVNRQDNMHPRFYDDDGKEIRMIDYYRRLITLKDKEDGTLTTS